MGGYVSQPLRFRDSTDSPGQELEHIWSSMVLYLHDSEQVQHTRLHSVYRGMAVQVSASTAHLSTACLIHSVTQGHLYAHYATMSWP